MTVKLVGSTSGSVSLQAPASTTGGAHRVLTLPDVNGTVATTTTAGKILQVVQGTSTTYTTTTSTSSYVDTTLSQAITPTAAGSKILVSISQSCNMSVSSYNTGMYIQLLEGSNVIYTPGSSQSFYWFFGGGNNSATTKARWNFVYLHTPSYSLGSALTYKTQMKAYTDQATTSARVQPSSDPSYIILQEVAS